MSTFPLLDWDVEVVTRFLGGPLSVGAGGRMFDGTGAVGPCRRSPPWPVWNASPGAAGTAGSGAPGGPLAVPGRSPDPWTGGMAPFRPQVLLGRVPWVGLGEPANAGIGLGPGVLTARPYRKTLVQEGCRPHVAAVAWLNWGECCFVRAGLGPPRHGRALPP